MIQHGWKMKTNSFLIAVVSLTYWLGLCNANAFYDSGQQRWLNRDPLGEPGFKTLCALTAMPRVDTENSFASLDRWIQLNPAEGHEASNLFKYVGNNSVNNIDWFGLQCVVAIFPFHNVTSGQGFDNFSIIDYIIVTGDDGTCPACDIPKGTVFAMLPIYFFPRARTDDWLKRRTGTDIHKIYNQPPSPPRWTPPPIS